MTKYYADFYYAECCKRGLWLCVVMPTVIRLNDVAPIKLNWIQIGVVLTGGGGGGG
jgi:hypothetical protein